MLIKEKRIDHIDIAKGIGIILIVASHVVLDTEKTSSFQADIYEHWCNLIASFYIPVFYLLSGIFESSSCDWIVYWKRIRRLLKYILAFWIWGGITYVLINGKIDIWKGMNYTPVWFLYVLLYISLIWGLVKRLKILTQLCVIIVMGGAGFLLAYYKHSYFYLGQILLCIPFYGIGYLYKDWFKEPGFRWKIAVLSTITWLLPTLLFDDPQNISINWVGRDFFSFYLAAFSGSVLLIELSKLINSNFLIWIGKNSLIIMMVHLLFKHINNNFLFIPIDSWWIWMAFVVVWVFLSCLWIPVFRNKYYKII